MNRKSSAAKILLSVCNVYVLSSERQQELQERRNQEIRNVSVPNYCNVIVIIRERKEFEGGGREGRNESETNVRQNVAVNCC